MEADFAGLGSGFLEGGVLCRDLAEGFVENRDLMLEPEAYVGVVVERHVSGGV
jgi:hypothetical protein